MSSPTTIEPDRTVRSAADRLVDHPERSLLVQRKDEPIGLLTEATVTALVAEGADPAATLVADVMDGPIVTIEPDASIEAAAETLRSSALDFLAVVDEGSLVGGLTAADLTPYLSQPPGGTRREESTEPPVTNLRADTAYEQESWQFEYFGDESTIDVGDRVTFSKPLTTDDVEAFAAASGDTNRLHLDAEYAAGTRFGHRIVHGTLVSGLISAALARLPGLIIYLSQDVNYLGPVDIDHRVTAEAEVIESLGGDRFKLATAVETEMEPVIEGHAVVMADPIPETA